MTPYLIRHNPAVISIWARMTFVNFSDKRAFMRCFIQWFAGNKTFFIQEFYWQIQFYWQLKWHNDLFIFFLRSPADRRKKRAFSQSLNNQYFFSEWNRVDLRHWIRSEKCLNTICHFLLLLGVWEDLNAQLTFKITLFLSGTTKKWFKSWTGQC